MRPSEISIILVRIGGRHQDGWEARKFGTNVEISEAPIWKIQHALEEKPKLIMQQFNLRLIFSANRHSPEVTNEKQKTRQSITAQSCDMESHRESVSNDIVNLQERVNIKVGGHAMHEWSRILQLYMRNDTRMCAHCSDMLVLVQN